MIGRDDDHSRSAFFLVVYVMPIGSLNPFPTLAGMLHLPARCLMVSSNPWLVIRSSGCYITCTGTTSGLMAAMIIERTVVDC